MWNIVGSAESTGAAWVADLQHADGCKGWIEIEPLGEDGPFRMVVIAKGDLRDPADLARLVLGSWVEGAAWQVERISPNSGCDSMGWARPMVPLGSLCWTFRAEGVTLPLPD